MLYQNIMNSAENPKFDQKCKFCKKICKQIKHSIRNQQFAKKFQFCQKIKDFTKKNNFGSL